MKRFVLYQYFFKNLMFTEDNGFIHGMDTSFSKNLFTQYRTHF